MPLTINKRHKTAVNLRIAKLLTGIRGLYGKPHVPAEGEGMIGTVQNQTGQDQNPELLTGRMETRSDDRPYVENLDEWKDRIPKRGIKKWVRRFRIVKHYLNLLTMLRTDTDIPLVNRIERLRMGRDFTPTERAEIIENINRKRLDAFHRDRAQRGGRLIINSLANLGFANVHVNAKGGTKFLKTIVFDRVEYSPLIYRYHVDAKRLPYKVSIGDLYADGVCTTLSASVEHPVRAKIEQKDAFVTGLWYEIEIAATLGIPNKCYFTDVLQLIPDSAHPLAFMLGYAENKRVITRSIHNLPHLLITGETLGGKSNGLNVIICCHLARNTPRELRTMMIDAKGGGIELGHYDGIAHMITDVDGVPNGIATNSVSGLKVLDWAVNEAQSRMDEFANYKIKNIDAWNKKFTKRKKPYIVVYTDELSELLDPEDMKLRKAILRSVRKLASQARAAGVHLIDALQTADRTNMPQTIKNNFPGRLAFAMADASASILAIGTGEAINLTPVGRAIWKHGTDKVMIQTPFISDGEIDQIVRNAKNGITTTNIRKSRLTPEEIITWAIEYNESSLRVVEVYSHFGERMEKAGIEKLLKEMDGQTFGVNERMYQILPGAGRRARIVVEIRGNLPSDPAFLQDGTQDTTDSTVTRDADGTETGE